MFHYIKQDVTKVTHGIVAHGCNCQGVMGSGVALAIKRKWPSAFDAYVRLCETHNYSKELLGMVSYVEVEREERETTWEGVPGGIREVIVANVFTQQHFGRAGIVYADLEAIAQGLAHVFIEGLQRNRPIYIPKVGCGLGGLKWDTQVGPVVERLANMYPSVAIYICDL